MMTRESAEFLLEILNGLTLKVGAPDFEETAVRVIAAKRELAVIVETTSEAPRADPR